MLRRLQRIIKKSEHTLSRKTNTDASYIIRGGFWLMYGQVINSIISLILSMLFARMLSQAEYGSYKYILSLVGIVVSFTLSGTGASLFRSVSKGLEGGFFTSVRKLSISNAIAGVVVIAMGVFYVVKGNTELGVPLVVAGIMMPVIESLDVYSSLLDGKRMFKISARYKNIRMLATSTVITVTLLATKSPWITAIAYFVSHALCTYVLYKITIQKYPPNKLVDPDTDKLTIHNSILNVFGAVAEKIDQILVFQYLGPIQLAIYNFSLLVPTQLQGYIKNIGTLALPKIAQSQNKNLKEKIFHQEFLLLCTMLPITIIVIILLPFAYKLLYPQYSESIIYAQILTAGTLLNSSLPLAYLESKKAIKAKYYILTTSAIVKISVQIVGCIFYGILGLVVSRVFVKLYGLVSLNFIIQNNKLDVSS